MTQGGGWVRHSWLPVQTSFHPALRPLCGSLGTTGLPGVGLTIVSSQEGGLVYIVLGVEGLSVQDCGCGDLPIGCVDVQPVGRIRQFRVPTDRRPDARWVKAPVSSPSRHPGCSILDYSPVAFLSSQSASCTSVPLLHRDRPQQWLMSLWWLVLDSGGPQRAMPTSPTFCRWVGGYPEVQSQ